MLWKSNLDAELATAANALRKGMPFPVSMMLDAVVSQDGVAPGCRSRWSLL